MKYFESGDSEKYDSDIKMERNKRLTVGCKT